MQFIPTLKFYEKVPFLVEDFGAFRYTLFTELNRNVLNKIQYKVGSLEAQNRDTKNKVKHYFDRETDCNQLTPLLITTQSMTLTNTNKYTKTLGEETRFLP